MNCVVAQSGGPTVAINASLAGVILENQNTGRFSHIYGAVNGILGVLNHQMLDLTEKSAEIPDFTDRLIHTPAMYLGSCRYKLPTGDEGQAEMERIFGELKALDAGVFFYIGGNDSMDTTARLASYANEHQIPVQVIGIPKTIDNDLMETDHTPGFASAAKYVAATVREVSWDAYIYAVKSVTIVEIMGRDAGWLTASAALARTAESAAPDRIYLPEAPFDLPAFIEDTRDLLKKKNTVVIAISEGIRDKDGNYISAGDSLSDNFGHNHLSGAGKILEGLLQKELGIKVRSIEINVLQRSAAHLASKTDLLESASLGRKAVQEAADGKTGVMTCIRRLSDDPYRIVYDACPVSDVANRVRQVPREWINEAGNDVTEEMVRYLTPLIQGEADVRYKDGLPDYLPVPHLIHE